MWLLNSRTCEPERQVTCHSHSQHRWWASHWLTRVNAEGIVDTRARRVHGSLAGVLAAGAGCRLSYFFQVASFSRKPIWLLFHVMVAGFQKVKRENFKVSWILSSKDTYYDFRCVLLVSATHRVNLNLRKWEILGRNYCSHLGKSLIKGGYCPFLPQFNIYNIKQNWKILL